MNRGAGGQTTFRTAVDGSDFLSVIAAAHERFGVEVGAYCLMPNHFHLLLHCPESGMGSFMQHVSAVYTRRFNRRADRDGPLFRSRYHAILIDSAEYLAFAGRYVHRNPLDLAHAPTPLAYRWSSLRYVADPDLVRPDWLAIDRLTELAGCTPASYLAMVCEDRSRPVTDPVALMRIAELFIEQQAASETRQLPALVRYVTTAALDQVGPRTSAGLRGALAFDGPRAEQIARSRAAVALRRSPDLARITRSIVEIAA